MHECKLILGMRLKTECLISRLHECITSLLCLLFCLLYNQHFTSCEQLLRSLLLLCKVFNKSAALIQQQLPTISFIHRPHFPSDDRTLFSSEVSSSLRAAFSCDSNNFPVNDQTFFS